MFFYRKKKLYILGSEEENWNYTNWFLSFKKVLCVIDILYSSVRRPQFMNFQDHSINSKNTLSNSIGYMNFKIYLFSINYPLKKFQKITFVILLMDYHLCNVYIFILYLLCTSNMIIFSFFGTTVSNILTCKS